jgi:hypothetical protein
MNYIKLLESLETSYHKLNQHLANDSLPQEIIILVSPVGSCPKYGHFCGKSWAVKDSEETRHEILIAGEYLIERSAVGILETLIHEMAHLANYINGIKDCTVTQYHNKHFKRRAEEFQLEVVKTKKGWSETKLTPALEKWLKDEKIIDLVEPFANIRRVHQLKDFESNRLSVSTKDEDGKLSFIFEKYADDLGIKKSTLFAAMIRHMAEKDFKEYYPFIVEKG